MIHYHGLPIWPAVAAAEVCDVGHAFVSDWRPEQLTLAVECCQSFAYDNGAFSAWKAKTPVTDWSAYYRRAIEVARFPSCDFLVVPDVIDGTEADNDALLAEWPLPRHVGAPVWHMHESLDRLARLAADWPRICLGSSGEFSTVGTSIWWARMRLAMLVVCDPDGRPLTKLHGLRMLSPKVFPKLPLSSADSTNIARNIVLDERWKGNYTDINKPARARVLRTRIEARNGAKAWDYTT